MQSQARSSKPDDKVADDDIQKVSYLKKEMKKDMYVIFYLSEIGPS